MPILPLLLPLLAANTVMCRVALSQKQLFNMLEILSLRVEELEQRDDLAEEVGKLGNKLEKLTEAAETLGDKLADGLDKIGETLRENADGETPTNISEDCAQSQRQDSHQMLSCVDVRRTDKTDGVHTLTVNNTQINVFCDQQTAGGGWTVIQRRRDGSVGFRRRWEEYRQGFGDLDGEFWLGLDNMHLLSKTQMQTLRVDLEAFDGSTAYAEYNIFFIDGPGSFYTLIVDGYNGTAGDALQRNNLCPFNTYDNDHNPRMCSVDRDAGWWVTGCTNANLNGPYLTSAEHIIDSINWFDWKNKYISLKHVEMKIRPSMYRRHCPPLD